MGRETPTSTLPLSSGAKIASVKIPAVLDRIVVFAPQLSGSAVMTGREKAIAMM